MMFFSCSTAEDNSLQSSQSSWLVCAQHHDHALGTHLISQQLAPCSRVCITADDGDLGSVSDPQQTLCSVVRNFVADLTIYIQPILASGSPLGPCDLVDVHGVPDMPNILANRQHIRI